MKPLYGVLEAANHWFATYHTILNKKLEMTESAYDPCLLYRSGPFEIVGMKTNDRLILADNDFVSIEEEAINEAKIRTKDIEYLTSIQPIKFNGAQIKLDSDGIVLTNESHLGGSLLVTDHDADSTSPKGITKKKLSTKEHHLVKRARGPYIAFVRQSEAFFDLSRAAQTVEFSVDDITLLNKWLQ